MDEKSISTQQIFVFFVLLSTWHDKYFSYLCSLYVLDALSFFLPIKALLAQLCALVLHLQYEAAPPPPLPPDRSEMFLALQWRRLHRPASRRQAGQDVGELRGGPELCSLARPDRGEEERREGGLTVAVVRSRRSCSRTCAPPSTLTGTRCPLPGPATPGRSV